MEIGNNLDKIHTDIPADVKLVAISKTKTVQNISEAYQWGQRIFGENKVQELVEKHPLLPEDIEWHFVGHLQTNKVKYIAPFVNLIHSVESLKLLKEINKEALKNNRIIDCLLQFYIAQEQTKFGLSINEAEEMLKSHEYLEMKNIKITGVMGMATFTDDMEVVRKEFRALKDHFNKLKNYFFAGTESFREISMGMSDDYKTAIEEGSTMIRLGSIVFGGR